MNSQGSQESRLTPQINVTPLIDVLLVLLIIFMILGPLRPSKFEVKAPTKVDSPQEIINELALVVTINREGGYLLNRTAAGNLADLESLLHSALDGRPVDRRTVFLKAPRTFNYGEVVKVIDIMKIAGSAPIGLQLEGLEQ